MKKKTIGLFGLLAFIGLGLGLATVKEPTKPLMAETGIQYAIREGEEPEIPAEVEETPAETETEEAEETEESLKDKILAEILEKFENLFIFDEEGKVVGINWEAFQGPAIVAGIVAFVKWLFEGGILIVIIRYFVKDKALAGKLENTVTNTIATVVPAQTQAIVTENIEKLITPIFTQLTANMLEQRRIMGVFCKCFALSQGGSQNSAQIIEELSKLNLTDQAILDNVKAYIDSLFAANKQAIADSMKALTEIQESSIKEIETAEVKEALTENGTEQEVLPVE